MKTILFILPFLFSVAIAQQNIHFGIKAGINKSQLFGDDYKGYHKSGFNGGVFTRVRVTKNSTAQFEILFSDKGCKSKYHKEDPTYQYHVKIYYLDFPVMFQYHCKNLIYETGIGLGFKREQWEIIENMSFNNSCYPVNETELYFSIGVSYLLSKEWGLGLRYNNSLLPIREQPSKQYNSLFTASLFFQTAIKSKSAN